MAGTRRPNGPQEATALGFQASHLNNKRCSKEKPCIGKDFNGGLVALDVGLLNLSEKN